MKYEIVLWHTVNGTTHRHSLYRSNHGPSAMRIYRRSYLRIDRPLHRIRIYRTDGPISREFCGVDGWL
jgi:hypothetical protein